MYTKELNISYIITAKVN